MRLFNDAQLEVATTALIGLSILLITVIILVAGIYMIDRIIEPDNVECRDGKLFEVTTRDNIIIYDPTYDDCEVKH